jgi:F0F1-type ATP synthase membrane subunit b/b'
MAADDNKGKGAGNSGTTGGQATGKAQGGQKISGEQIFTTTEENTGGESFATTGAGSTGGSATGGNTGGATSAGGGNQANLSDAVSDAVSGDTSKAKEMLSQAKSATGEVASKALGQVQEKASTFVDTKTSDVAQGLTGIADTVRQFTENLRSNQDAPIAQTVAQYGDTVTQQVEKLADYLDRADLNKLSRDVETFARRNPVVFIGGAFAAGILLSRFIKSSQQRALPPSRQLTAGTSRKGTRTTGMSTGTTTGGTTSGTATATGEPPALGKALPSVDAPKTGTGTSDTGTSKTV